MSDEWQTAPLRQFAEVSRQRIDPRLLGEQALVHYSIPVLDETDAPATELASSIASHKFVVETDAVLVSLLNPRIPRVWLAKGGPNAVCSTEFAVLTPAVPDLDVEFLHLMCQSQTFWEELQKRAVGTTGSRQRAKAEGLLGIEVSVPPLPIQRRIVDLMTHLDSHLANLRAEREAANTTRESLVENLLVEVGGEELRLGDCLSIARGGSPRPIDDYFTDAADGLNWIKIGDVSATGKYITKTAQKIRPEGLSKTRQVKAGDFLLSNSMSFGRPYILHIDGCIHDGWLVLSDDSATFNQDYLYNLLRSRAVQEQFASLAAGSGVKNLNISVVQSVKVNVPSIENQVRVVESVNAWESLIEQLDSEIDCLQDIRSSMLGLLLAGQVELDSGYDSIVGEVA